MTWIAQWPFNEASSGTSPTTAADAESSPVDLSITFAGAGEWTSNAAGNGISVANANPGTRASTPTISGTKLDFIHGATGFSLETVVNLPASLTDKVVCHIGDGTTEVCTLATDGASFIVFYLTGDNGALGLTWNDAGASAGAHHLLVVVDTTEATAANRVKLYVDGSPVSLSLSFGSIPSQNSTFAIDANTRINWGATPDGSFSWENSIYWGAIADHVVDSTEAAARATALLADNDTVPGGGGSTEDGAGAIAGSLSISGISPTDSGSASVSGAASISGAGASLSASAATISATASVAGTSPGNTQSNCVEFATTASSPGLLKNSGALPSAQNCAIRIRVRCVSYANYGITVVVGSNEASGADVLGFEFAANDFGLADFFRFAGGSGSVQSAWAGVQDTGWHDVIIIANASNVLCSIRPVGGSWTDFTFASVPWSTAYIGFLRFPPVLADSNSTVRFGVLEVFGTALPGGAANAAAALALLKAGCDYRAPIAPADDLFYNDCTDAITVEVDGSATGQNWSKTGAPTTITDDNPGFLTHSSAAGSIAVTSVVSGESPSEEGAATVNGAAVVAGSGASMAAAAGAIAGTSSIQTSNLLVSAHASGRYLIAGGKPVFLVMESAWALTVGLTQEDVLTYLDDRASRGVNAVAIMVLIDNILAADPPNNAYGEPPFTGTIFQSTPNEAYWEQVDFVFDACRQRGIVVLAFPAYYGAAPSFPIMAEHVAAASVAQMEAYGEFLGSRYVDYDNLMWGLWGDGYDAGLETRYQALIDGIKATDNRHTLFTAQISANISTHEIDFDWMTLNALYAYEIDNNYVYEEGEDCWNYLKGGTEPVPVISFETLYENEWGTGPERIRRQFLHAICSGCLAGFLYGNGSIYAYGYGLFQGPGDDWRDHLADDGLADLLRIWAMLSERPWHTLVHPSQSDDSSFVTAGRGSFGGVDWVVATRDAETNATFAVCYRQSGTSYTIDMSTFAGPVTARWFDARAGSLTAATGSPIANTGTHVFNPGSDVGANSAGANDWILLLEVLGSSGAIIGASTLAAVAQALAAAVAAVGAAGAVSAAGRSIASGQTTVAGTATVTGAGIARAAALGTASGSGTVMAVGASEVAGVGDASATATVNGIATSLSPADGAVSATATVSGFSGAPTFGAGTVGAFCSVAATGRALAAGTVLVACTGSVAAIGAPLARTAGAIACSGTLAAAGRSLFQATGACSSTATVTATSARLASGAGAISGAATVSANGDQPGQGSGAVGATVAVAAAGAGTVFATGHIASVTSIFAVGAGAARTAGLVSVNGSAVATGVAGARGAGAIAAQSASTAVGTALAQCSGSIAASVAVTAVTFGDAPTAGEIVSVCSVFGSSVEPAPSQAVSPPTSRMDIARAPSSRMVGT